MGTNDIKSIIKVHIEKVDPDAKVILFGSRARNEETSESDWDLLVLTTKEITPLYKNSIRDELYYAEIETNQVISSLIQNENEWKNYQLTSIYKNILNEGIVL